MTLARRLQSAGSAAGRPMHGRRRSMSGHEARIEDVAANVADEQAEPADETQAARPRMPLSVALLWLCAFAGLGVYAAGLYFPQLGRP